MTKNGAVCLVMFTSLGNITVNAIITKFLFDNTVLWKAIA